MSVGQKVGASFRRIGEDRASKAKTMPDPFPLAFVVAPTDQGTFIVNRFDRRDLPGTISIGVGHQLLSSGSYDQSMVTLINFLLDRRLRYQGDGMVMVDDDISILEIDIVSNGSIVSISCAAP